MLIRVLFPLLLLINWSCQKEPNSSLSPLQNILEQWESIPGNTDYLGSSYVSAGDQLYIVGHQNGQFPNLGWHVQGEMGGIWQHPIKLMDAYAFQISNHEQTVCLDQAVQFSNYPLGSKQDFQLSSLGLSAELYQIVAEGEPAAIIEIHLHNQTQQAFDGLLNFTGISDLRPVWLGARTNMLDQQDSSYFDKTLNAWIAKDQSNPWYAIWGSSLSPTGNQSSDCHTEIQGKIAQGGNNYAIQLERGASMVAQFYLAGSSKSLEEAQNTYLKTKTQVIQLIEEKAQKFQNLKNRSQVNLPDSKIQEAFTWTKYASEWLHFEVPGVAGGIAAGIPDYPWWFGCDQTYSARGLVHAGMPELAKRALESLVYFSEKNNGTGQVVHEVSTNGAVYNPGNINETPHFIASLWEYFQWTGDEELLRKAWPMVKKGLNWLESKDLDNNGYPDGHGMMEIQGMDAEMIDVIAYTQEAYAAAAQIALFLGEPLLYQDFQKKAEILQKKINTEWWVDHENSFADFRASRKKASSLLDAAIVRADTLNKPWSVKDLQAAKDALNTGNSNTLEPYAFYHNWVVNTPLETGAADSSKALLALRTAKRFTNPYGVYVTGIDRKKAAQDLAAFAALKAKEDFNYTGAVMTLPTGVQAIAACQYGQMDDALDYLQRMARSFSYAAPGSMYEVSPDYGMLVQAWNIYALAKPIVGFFFGIQPEAQHQRINLRPQLPSDWQNASISQLPIGDNLLSMEIQGNRYKIKQRKDWELRFYVPKGTQSVQLNGVIVAINTAYIVLEGKENSLELSP